MQLKKSEKWQVAALALLAIDWPIMNSIEYGIVTGFGWDVALVGILFLACCCGVMSQRAEEAERQKKRQRFTETMRMEQRRTAYGRK